MSAQAMRPGGFARRGRGPVEKPRDFKGTMGRLWHFVGKERKHLWFIFLIVGIESLLILLGPYLIGVAVDAILDAKVKRVFTWLEITVLVLLIAYIVNSFLALLQGWMMAGVSQRVVKNLRSALFRKLQRLPLHFFDARTHGEMMSRFSNDIDNVSSSVSQSTTQLITGLFTILGSLVMMLILSPLLTLASLITVPLVFFLARTITKRTAVLFRNQQRELGKLNGHIEETISGIQVVKAFNHEEKAIADFEEANQRLRKVGLKAQIWSGFLMPMMNVINNLGFTAVAVVGGLLAGSGMITVGVVASFISYSRQFVRPLNDLANIFNILQSGVAGAERVFEVLDEREEPEDDPDAIELGNPKGQVVFENVRFGYRPDAPILKDLSFEAEAGSSTAIVGRTGAGKTTIVSLLTRFYDVTEGRILIDGRDIRLYSRQSLRKCFGVVLQDTYLFSGTIRENITYGKPDATDEEVERAAHLANAQPFIQRLPQKYDTVLTENGGNLSQGERQLLAIARVILADPSILILDEATSSIDTRTEHHIQEALLRVMKGRTSFIIAHRLNTIRDADKILMVEAGEIVEQGSHEALMRMGGRYRQMFLSQFHHTGEA